MEKEFEKELLKLLKKYDCSITATRSEVRVLFWCEKGNVKSKIKSFKFN